MASGPTGNDLLASKAARDVVAAGACAALVSAAPSTVFALATRRDPLEGAIAAGSLLLPGEQRRGRLVLAAVPVHLGLSLAWAGALAPVLSLRPTPAAAALSGFAIAVLDLGLIGRRFPRIRALPVLPQVADHLAYALTVVAVLRRRGIASGRN